jgi:hypothetical protein
MSINSGTYGIMVMRLGIEMWVIGEGGTEKGGQEKGWVGEERVLVAAGFCGPCAYLGVFLL